ncbi:TPA: hypothetical protein ACIAIH_001438 [Enterobacter bugandensis]
MQHRIVSNNIFFRAALTHLLKDSITESPVCVIELDSCKNLDHVKKIIIDLAQPAESRYFIAGGASINAKIMSPYVSFKKNDRAPYFMKKIHSSDGFSGSDLLNILERKISLQKLTLKEKIITQHLSHERNLDAIACTLQLNVKTLYTRASGIASKLNLDNLHQFRLFAHNEKLDFLKILSQ